ncbi:RHS repeat-associated core domain-containing protein [Ancylomarina sp. DW003]|nr:RHS repeat-associated core domain-containing protein [Ancylomarina sp. DW003]MDE5420601.1 RHS repeat-associated core domain-containing protein [Ancylomarina sp. DW003]
MDDKERIALIEKESGQTVVRYQLNDHLGSSAIELDENANIISYEEYHPFGTTSYQKLNGNISQKRYKYVGKEHDNETGLYYYGARYYASWLCRFVSVDPLSIERQWLTPYNYVQNNPINRIDPTGALDEDPPTASKGSQNSEEKKSSDPNDLLRKFNEFFGFASPKDTTLLHQAINNTVEKLSSARDASSYYLNGALYSETGSEQQKVLFDLYDSSKADVKKYEDGLAILIRAAYKTHKYNKNIADYNDGFTLLLDSSAKILEYGTYGVTAIETMGVLPGLVGGFRQLGGYFSEKLGTRIATKTMVQDGVSLASTFNGKPKLGFSFGSKVNRYIPMDDVTTYGVNSSKAFTFRGNTMFTTNFSSSSAKEIYWNLGLNYTTRGGQAVNYFGTGYTRFQARQFGFYLKGVVGPQHGGLGGGATQKVGLKWGTKYIGL